MSLAAAIVLIVTGVGLTAGVLVKVFVLPLRRLARETSLIATANPAYRIDTWRLPPLRGLAVAIDELAERAEAAQGELDERIAAARMDLERERNTLAALMSELSLPVLVCNPEGQILLYNVAARELLDPGGRPSGLVGLGRSIFGILDRSLFNHALGRARAGDGGGGQGMRLAATAVGGQLLRVGVAPVRRGDAEPAGFVLTLEDVTRRAEVGARRDALLRSLTEGTRASVGAIRAAIESLLDYPGMEAAERQRFMTIIREEAVALGTRVEDALCESAASLGSEWRLAEILARDLVAALQRRLESEEGPATADPAVAAGEVGDKLWLRVDSYAVVQAVAHLALRLRSEAG
ncbi:MAG: DNA polymerase III subunit epsilon, partial [Solirubrobacterales bacterium]